MKKKTLSPEVAEKFNLVGVAPGTHDFNGYGRFDLCSMTLSEAEALIEKGFTWLVPKKKNTPAPPTTNA
jgi:hypothetical protein